MKTVFQTLSKSLLVGAGYAATLAVTSLLLSQSVDAQSLLWSFIGAAVMGFALGSVAASMPATWSRHMLVWGSAIFLNIASLTIEGRFFAPDLVRGSIILLLLQQLLVAFVAAWLIVKLFAPISDSAPPALERAWFSWLWRFGVSALSYVFFYYFFGALTYLLVTGPYYETHAGGLVVPAPAVLFKAELVRALLMALSLIPFLLNFPANRRRVMFVAGMILFAVGGIMPLLMQVGSLPLVVLIASAVEIFCGNFSLGLVAGRLMGRPENGMKATVRESRQHANA